MKLQFKRQKFQEDAAQAVVDVFKGQGKQSISSYNVDPGKYEREALIKQEETIGYANAKIELIDAQILENLRETQRKNQLLPSESLSGRYNFTIEMETGVGKTYAYIKTIYELNKAYGWIKFIVVTPSVAVREGVKKSFETMEEHFAEEYGKKIRCFIYNSNKLEDIRNFATDSSIQVMIINSQAFNATKNDALRIDKELDALGSRKPRDVIAATRPILIIDEPQSVEGPKTKEGLKNFKPLFTLRYSATHKEEYDMVYRLDAIDAYNKKLVKKISVVGIRENGSARSGSEGYVYLEGINLSKKAPTASIEFHARGASGLKTKRAIVDEGYNIYPNSGELEAYRNGYTIKTIDGLRNCVEFLNGLTLYAGDMVGKVEEAQIRRIQIRETIEAHLRREHKLFRRGIKVLSLFFIDEVAKYRLYEEGEQKNGEYATIFEEEYKSVSENLQREFKDEEFLEYLRSIPVEKTHAGYFSIDKKGKMIDSKKNREGASDDVDAYELIMRNKERLLERDPKRSPVRFIFSHSALREGWDNPNVFQICALKQSSSGIRKRQEVGRGLRLCVDQNGARMDENALGNDVHRVNELTIVASESYDAFAKALQHEIAENVPFRPKKVTTDLFKNKVVCDENDKKYNLTEEDAGEIYFQLKSKGYLDKKNELTEKYLADRDAGAVRFDDELEPYSDSIVEILDSVYHPDAITIEDARKKNVAPEVNGEKMAKKEFQELWNRINAKTYYLVDFDDEELIKDAVSRINHSLRIGRASFLVESGTAETIKDKDALQKAEAFQKTKSKKVDADLYKPDERFACDLVGRVVDATDLTRNAVFEILSNIEPAIFELFQYNPEEFIAQAAKLINDAKGSVIVQHIAYHMLNDKYETDVFTEPGLRGQLGVNAIETPNRHLFDYLIYDSDIEKKFAKELEIQEEVAVYVKLPNAFYISTPVGRYNPDWAIAFTEGSVKHIYFVAETKGSIDSLELREIESAKIHCAREHFKALAKAHQKENGVKIKYDVVSSYADLLKKVNSPT